MCIVVKTQEGPAIVICLREGAIHSALALPNAPCRQGVDVTESGKLFSDWLYVELCSAVSLCRDNGLNCGAVNNVPTYYREIVTKLSCDQVETLESHLRILFNQTAPAPAGSTSDWSHNCQSRGLLLGHIFVIGRQGIDLIFAALSVYIAEPLAD